MDSIYRAGGPIIVPVVVQEIRQIKAPGSREGQFTPEFDLVPQGFYVESSDIGRPMFAPRMDLVQAIQRMVFG
jgi:hypothetical protein